MYLKKLLLLALACSMTSCATKVDKVPDSGREVVAPSGNSASSKSWNRMTKHEGDSMLGPLAQPRR